MESFVSTASYLPDKLLLNPPLLNQQLGGSKVRQWCLCTTTIHQHNDIQLAGEVQTIIVTQKQAVKFYT